MRDPTPLLLLAAVVLGGCRSRADRADDPGAAPTSSAEPYRCAKDADCPPLSCGPCTPGTEIVHERVRVECAINPCTQGLAVCNPKGLCVVHPATRKSPAAWCRKCFDLEGAKKKLCGARGAPRSCAKDIDDAVAACDDARCEGVRARLTPPEE
jgi:hypothetical protein